MPARVLDSFALIAYFRDEPGAEAVEDMLVVAGKKDSPLFMTDVNYAEVKYSIVKDLPPVEIGANFRRDDLALLLPFPLQWNIRRHSRLLPTNGAFHF